MVIGLFANCDNAEVALSNFSEIEVSMRDISAVSLESDDVDALATLGPLTGVLAPHIQEALQGNMTQEEWDQCKSLLDKGGVLLVVSDKHVPSEVIEEMLLDYKADHITIPEM